jgi:hypothetical protein
LSRTSRTQGLRDRREHAVAGEVAVAVVDQLEVVQVEDEHGGTALAALSPLQHPVGAVLPGGGVEQSRLPVDARDLLEVAHEDGAVQDDQRWQHEQRVQRARRGDRPGRQRTHRQRRELEDDLVAPTEHLAERALRRTEQDRADDEAGVHGGVTEQRRRRWRRARSPTRTRPSCRRRPPPPRPRDRQQHGGGGEDPAVGRCRVGRHTRM